MANYQSFAKDLLNVRIYDEETEMGKASADFAAEHLNSTIKNRGSANLILATGTSQFSFLGALQNKELDWSKITVFHLDEYVGISDKHPASFRKYLKERILDIVKPGKYYLIDGDAENIVEGIAEYERVLKEYPIDLACIGIGENGHIAFNDPPVADFNDPHLVKIVELDQACRMQQLNEGWFPSLEEVPKEAITLTITAIMNCKAIVCTVPGIRKAEAVNRTLNGPINTECPATILRNHPEAVLFLDNYSSTEIKID